MFQWEKQRTSLDTVAARVLRVDRSLADVQVSLPGLSPETASAYLCAYHDGEGIRVAVVLHLLQSDQLAFYMNNDGPLDSEAAGRALGEGLLFAESLGFSLGDLEFRQRPGDVQNELWSSLAFFMAAEGRQPVGVATPDASPNAKPAEPATASPVAGHRPRSTEPEEAKSQAAVPRRPSAEELLQRRKAFIQNLGRLLGML